MRVSPYWQGISIVFLLASTEKSENQPGYVIFWLVGKIFTSPYSPFTISCP